MALKIRRLSPLVFSLVLSTLVIVLTIRFRSQLQGLGNAGLLGLFVVSIIGNATLVVPVNVFAAACAFGAVYHPLAVGIAAGAGAALGELTGYWVGASGSGMVPHGKLYQRLEHFMKARGMFTIFALAAIPNPIFDVGGMIAGALRMPMWQFLGATAAGKIVRLTATAWVCAGGLPYLQRWLAG